jgi:hypothetical protein
MGQEAPRPNPGQIFVFQQGTSTSERFLIPGNSIPAGDRNNSRLRALKVTDLMNIVGLRESGGDVSPQVKALTLEDIHALGRAFAMHWGKDYPDKIFSCCCCG